MPEHSAGLPGNLPAQIGNMPRGAETMSSRAIAELVNSRHDDVKRSIDRLVERGVIVQPPLAGEHSIDTMGRSRVTEVYQIGKRDSYVIVAQLSPEFTAALVDYWQDHEGKGVAQVPVSAQMRETRLVFSEAARIAKLAGLKDNALILSAAMATKRAIGTDPLEIVGRTHLPAPKNVVMVNPTAIGKELDARSAQAVNGLLCQLGYQTPFRDDKQAVHYEPTDKGIAAGAQMMDTGKKQGGRMIQQLLWPHSIVAALRREIEQGGAP